MDQSSFHDDIDAGDADGGVGGSDGDDETDRDIKAFPSTTGKSNAVNVTLGHKGAA